MVTKRFTMYDFLLEDAGTGLIITAVFLAVLGIVCLLVWLRRRTRRISDDRSDYTPRDGRSGAGTSEQ